MKLLDDLSAAQKAAAQIQEANRDTALLVSGWSVQLYSDAFVACVKTLAIPFECEWHQNTRTYHGTFTYNGTEFVARGPALRELSKTHPEQSQPQ